MNIKTHTIEIEYNDLDILGESVVFYLEQEMKCYKKYSTLKLLCEDELNLLHELCECGFKIYYRKQQKNGKGISYDHDLLTDPWEWAKKRIKEICLENTQKSTD